MAVKCPLHSQMTGNGGHSPDHLLSLHHFPACFTFQLNDMSRQFFQRGPLALNLCILALNSQFWPKTALKSLVDTQATRNGGHLLQQTTLLSWLVSPSNTISSHNISRQCPPKGPQLAPNLRSLALNSQLWPKPPPPKSPLDGQTARNDGHYIVLPHANKARFTF